MNRPGLVRHASEAPPTRGATRSASLPGRLTIPLQVGGGLVCLGLLAVRVVGLDSDHPAFAGSGASVLVIAALAAQLAAYLFYLPLGAWVVTSVLRPRHPDLGWRHTLTLFAASTLPLLAGWALRVGVGWLRPADTVASAGDFHSYVERLWWSVSLRADAGLILPQAWSLLAVPARALSVFWLWHAAILWSGLVERTGPPRRTAWSVLASLFGMWLVAVLLQAVVAARWQGFVVWTP